MKVICPKCQFENQADSTRVVCARCATIIEVRVDQGSGSGFDSNGKRQTARLPFAANSNSGNLNSGNLSSGNLNSGNLGRGNSGPLGGGQQNRDTYATRIGDDFDDVLDIPRPAQNEFSNTAEATPVFEDVFSTANYDSASNYDFSAYEKKPTAPTGPYPTDLGSQRVTQDYTAPAEPEFMGWPVLPENNQEEEEAGVSYSNNRGGLVTRIALLVAAFGVLSFLAYYFLWDYVVKRQDKAEQINAGTIEDPTPSSQVGAVNPPAAEVKPSPVAQAESPKTTTAPPIVKVDPPPANANKPTKGTTLEIPPIQLPVGSKGPSQSPKPAPAAQPPSSTLPDTPRRGNLTVQAGSFPDKGQADERVSRLKAAGVDARAVRADIPGLGIWYRVQVGLFPAREEATRYGNQLRSKGLVQDFLVVTVGKP